MKQFKITEYKDDVHRRRKNNSGHDMVIYGHRMFPCIRRIQKRKQPDRGFYSIFLRIDNKKSVHCKQSSKKDIF